MLAIELGRRGIDAVVLEEKISPLRRVFTLFNSGAILTVSKRRRTRTANFTFAAIRPRRRITLNPLFWMM
jgi:hypothetical protein